MRVLQEPFKKLNIYDEVGGWLAKGDGFVNVTGSSGSGTDRVFLMEAFADDAPAKMIITYSDRRAEEIYSDLRFYSRDVYMYPAKDILFFSADVHGNAITRRRMEVLRKLATGEKCTIVATVDALFDKIPALSYMNRYVINIHTMDHLNLDEFKGKLVDLGYEKTDSVEEPGQFAVRGGIIDIFPLTEDCPYRIDMWDDEVDTIKTFDAESQRSIENVDQLVIYPAGEMVLSKDRINRGIRRIKNELASYSKKLKAEFKTEAYARIKREVAELEEQLTEFSATYGVDSYVDYFYSDTVSIIDCLPEKSFVFIDETSKVSDRAVSSEQSFVSAMSHRLEGGYVLPGQLGVMYSYDDVIQKMRNYRTVGLDAFTSEDEHIRYAHRAEIECREVHSYRNNFDSLVSDIRKWKKDRYSVLFVSPSSVGAKRMVDNLMDNDVICHYLSDSDKVLSARDMAVMPGRLRAGFMIPEMKMVVVSEGDVFSSRTGPKKGSQKKLPKTGEIVKSFSDVSVGDYVVHEKYGIGVYQGLEKIEVDGAMKDYLVIGYAEGGKLYVLASETDRIQKYRSKEGRPPKINRMGGSDWQKIHSKVKGHVSEIAQHLVELYAERQSKSGYAYSEDSDWQKEFEETFPYKETDDQMRAIADVKADMESDKIMDRLVCGDVGFGKTEVAIRAAFKAVGDSRQVAYLVPTTILAEQHYETFTERMKDYPVNVRLLCRFCTQKEIKNTLRELKEGKVDIVIGTHRLLSKDVEFNNLGLLIIDEEQRFGVNHKEKIKEMKTNVDVLTLTATPIPRTLHMSLVGIRDMSLLEEPPVDRRAIQTYVMEYDKELAREAIARELSRQGQVYYVYNRVKDIEQFAAEVQSLVPGARVEYAHGQMDGRTLEDIMYRFNKKEIDVLVCTTIIETGLDIPNANTIIIHDADNFGLAQLYQLRGRVGRSDRSAFAFMFYRRNRLISEVAEKRLRAIKEYTDLGSGVKISKADLNIRGAGSVLGESQSGNYEVVGYDLYCKMLNDAVREIRGETVFQGYETEIDIPVDSFIPETYVKNDFVKLELCKRISLIKNEDEYNDIIDELIDRFGDIPEETMNLLDVALLRAEANACYITRIWFKDDSLRFVMYNKARINVDGIDSLVNNYCGRMKFVMGAKPEFVLRLGREERNDLIRQAEFVVSDMSQLLMTVDTKEDHVG